MVIVHIKWTFASWGLDQGFLGPIRRYETPALKNHLTQPYQGSKPIVHPKTLAVRAPRCSF